MSNQPPIIRPNGFRSTAPGPLNPIPDPPSILKGRYLIGCLGFCLLSLGLIATGLFLVVRDRASAGRRALKDQRPESGQRTELPLQLIEKINASALPNPAAPRQWTEADERKLSALIDGIEEEEEGLLDVQRLAGEMTRIRPARHWPMTEGIWAVNLREAISIPYLYGGIQCISSEWISKEEARVILIGENYHWPQLAIVYLTDNGERFRIYDWRETLQPVSEAEFWALYFEANDSERRKFDRVANMLDAIYGNEQLSDEEMASQLQQAYSGSSMSAEFRAIAVNLTATYLDLLPDARKQMAEIAAKMDPSSFTGAYVWKARVAQAEDSQQAFELATKAMARVGWHPAAANIAFRSARTTEDFLSVRAYIAQSLQYGILDRPEELLDANSDVVAAVLESLFGRCSEAEASDCLVELLYEHGYWSESRLVGLKLAIADLPASPLLQCYLDYRMKALSDEPGEQLAALEKLVAIPLPDMLQSSVVDAYFVAAGEAGNLAGAIETIAKSTIYDSRFLEDQLAESITQAQDASWDLQAALPRLQGNSSTTQAARAVALERAGQDEQAFQVLLEMWPGRQQEMLDQETYYPLDYSNAGFNLLRELTLKLDREPEFLESSSDKSMALSALAEYHFNKGDFEALEALLVRAEHPIYFQPYYQAIIATHVMAASAPEDVANGLRWIEESTDELDSWKADDFLWATAPMAGEVWELQGSLVEMSIQAGILPTVWDSVSKNLRDVMIDELLLGRLGPSRDRSQLVAMQKRLRTIREPSAESLLGEVESRLFAMEGNYLEAGRAILREKVNRQGNYKAVESSILSSMLAFRRVDLAKQLIEEIPPDRRSEQHDNWKQLCDDLVDRDGSAISNSQVIESFVPYLGVRQVALLSEWGAMMGVSREYPIGRSQFELPSMILRFNTDVDATMESVSQTLVGWTESKQLARFPSAKSAWTKQDPQGYWICAIYQGFPPGLREGRLSEKSVASKMHVQFVNISTSAEVPRDSAVHSFVLNQFGENPSVEAVFSVANSVTWPSENWTAAIERYLAVGKKDPRLCDYADGWEQGWLDYARSHSGENGYREYNFGGIIETLPCKLVPPQEESASEDQPKVGGIAGESKSFLSDTYELLETSLAFPAFESGLYVQ